MRGKDTPPVKDILKGLFERMEKGADGGIAPGDIIKAWPGAAGREAARHSRPTGFKARRLRVVVDSSSWLYELSAGKKEILKRFTKEFGEGKIEDIRFRIGQIEEKGDGKER